MSFDPYEDEINAVIIGTLGFGIFLFALIAMFVAAKLLLGSWLAALALVIVAILARHLFAK